MQILSDQNSKLSAYIKYDTTLGREQNIEFSKESSLANKDRIVIKGGVKLTNFHPDKQRSIGNTTIEEEGESDDGSPGPDGRPKEKK